MRSAASGMIAGVDGIRQRAVKLAARAGLRFTRRRLERTRSLRWAARVPLVTLASTSLVALIVLRAPAAPRRPGRRLR